MPRTAGRTELSNAKVIQASAVVLHYIGADADLRPRVVNAFGTVRSRVAAGPGSGNPFLFDGRGMRSFGLQYRSSNSTQVEFGRYDETGTVLLDQHFVCSKSGGGFSFCHYHVGEFPQPVMPGLATLGFFDLVFREMAGVTQTIYCNRIWVGMAN
jgi:hypothetical protein